jgi:polysaccharide deacetylase family protein (PEP-CTERM system associated)
MEDAAAPAGANAVRNVMTIDVEDYFHVSVFDGVVPRARWNQLESRVCANTERLLQLFADANVRATFFILGWVADRFPALVTRIASQGHELASHGYNHRLVYDQTLQAFRDDVRRSKALIEEAGGVPVHGYRAPSYSVTPRSLWALDVLIEEGYTYDSSIFPIRHDRYGIPLSPRHAYVLERGGGALIEVPGSTTELGPVNLPIAGGGYFRILPLWWAMWGIARVNRLEQRPVIFYLHPWEVDPDQPRLQAGLLSRFRHYRNLDKTEARLRALVDRFEFGTMAEMLQHAGLRESQMQPAWALPYLW